MPRHPEKLCKTCKQVKPVTKFYKNSNKGDGYRSSCKPCTYLKTRQNKDKYNAKRRSHYNQNRKKILKKAAEKRKTNKKGKLTALQKTRKRLHEVVEAYDKLALDLQCKEERIAQLEARVAELKTKRVTDSLPIGNKHGQHTLSNNFSE